MCGRTVTFELINETSIRGKIEDVDQYMKYRIAAPYLHVSVTEIIDSTRLSNARVKRLQV